jgi:hypothetical protein
MNKIAAYAIFTCVCSGFNVQAGVVRDVAMQDLTPISLCDPYFPVTPISLLNFHMTLNFHKT